MTPNARSEHIGLSGVWMCRLSLVVPKETAFTHGSGMTGSGILRRPAIGPRQRGEYPRRLRGLISGPG